MNPLPWTVALVIVTGSWAQAQNVESKPAGHDKGHAHVVKCPDSPLPSQRPATMECAILVRKAVARLPEGPVVWRLETFPSTAAAQQVQNEASLMVQASGKVWLMSLAKPGQRSMGGTFIAEVGPLPILPAPNYEFLIAEAYAGSDAMNLPHTHSGPEAWYVLAGKQCVETPDGTKTAKAGQGMFEPAETPMRLTIVGPETRDAFFIVVHDPARPWNALSDWTPKDLCALQ